MSKLALGAAVLTTLLLAACGDTRTSRVVTGAAGGAVAGEVIADKPVEGAVAGGLIGAVR
jgi:osmotically inducible lipoprotein OsmB